MNIRVNHSEIWIALANIQIDKNLSSIKDASYAYVTVIGLTKSKIDFRKKVAEELLRLNFRLLKLEEVEKFKERVVRYKVEKSIYELVQELLNSDAEIKFSTFHTYD